MKKIDEFKVGLLVLLGIVIFIFAYWVIKGISFSQEGYKVIVKFKTLAGVNIGGDVRMADGIKIGKVNNIKMQNNLAYVELKIKKDVQITSGSKITISSSSILGEKFISISYNPEEGHIIKDGEILRGEDPLSMMDSVREFGTLMKNFNTLLSSGKNKKLFKNISDVLNKTTIKIDNLMKKSTADIESAFKNFNYTSKKLAAISTEFTGIGKKIHKLLNTIQNMSSKMDKNIPKTLDDLKTAAKHFALLMKKASKGDGILSALLSDKKFYYDIKFILENIKRFTYKLRQDPSILIWRGKK